MKSYWLKKFQKTSSKKWTIINQSSWGSDFSSLLLPKRKFVTILWIQCIFWKCSDMQYFILGNYRFRRKEKTGLLKTNFPVFWFMIIMIIVDKQQVIHKMNNYCLLKNLIFFRWSCSFWSVNISQNYFNILTFQWLKPFRITIAT
jgi:hypothetical protein